MQKLKDSELSYRRLFEAAQDGILILNAETGLIEDVNPYLIKMLGYSRDEFVKKKLWEVGAFADIEASQDAFEALQENEYIRYEDLPLKTKDGRLIQVEFVSNVYLVGGEKVIQCNIRDITEHRRIIAALQENEKKYHDLINQSPDGYFIIELSGNILTVNKAMCKELEFSEEEFLSMNIWDIIPEQYLDQYRKRLTRMLTGESLEEAAEYAVHGKEGKMHYVEVLSAPHYSGKDIIGFQGVARDITARKRAEEALRASKLIIEGIINAIPVRVFWKDKNLVYLGCNAVFARDKGFSDPKDVIGKDDYQMAQRDQAELYRGDDRQVIESGQSKLLVEEPQTTPEGDIITLLTSKVPLRNSKGEIIGVLGTYMDITERKRAEEMLRESDERFENAFKYSAIGMALVSPEGKWLKVNSRVCSILGYSEDELLSKTFQEITHPDDLDIDFNYIRQMLAGEIETYTMEKRYFHRKRNIVWVLLAVALVRDSVGAPLYFVSQIEDITERKQAEETAHESQARFEGVVNMAVEAIISIDESQRVILFNQGAERVFGYTAAEALGLPLDKFLPSSLVGRHRSLVQNFRADDDKQSRQMGKQREIQGRRRDGTLFPTEVNISKVTVKGRIIYTAILQDITERKRAEEELIIANQELAFQNEEKEKRAAELVIANQELLFQNEEKEKRAAELIIANEETLRRLRQTTALREIDQAIAGSMHLQHVLEIVLKHVMIELGVDAAVILLNDPREQVLKYELGKGLRTNALQFTRLRLGEGYAGQAVLGRQTVYISNLQTRKTDFLRSPTFSQEGFISYFGIPLIAKDEIMGVLEIFHRSLFNPNKERLDFMETLARQIAIAIHNATLYKDLQRSNVDLAMAYEATIVGWSQALDLRDKETEGHTQRVTELTVKLAREMGIPEADITHIRRGALLHDIGKMGVPDSILLKPGALTDEEWVSMRRHPQFAFDMLSPIAYLQKALDIPYCHHEKWDGSGYPRGLKGEYIPLAARVFAVIDVYDALTSDRPYRPAWTEEKVREHIKSLGGTHFDPKIVELFLKFDVETKEKRNNEQ